MIEEFVLIFEKNIKRDGAEDLLKWILGSDFVSAPASTRYHLATKGGLVQHSVLVYKKLEGLIRFENLSIPDETAAICGLLHDLCKVDYYTSEMRNVKNEQGQWVQAPFYAIEDKFPYGHGEKSVIIIEQFMKLSAQEALAIRWHMGGFDDSVRGNIMSIGNAYNMSNLAVLLHVADLMSTYIDEVKM